jgi:hypothetical protein
VGELIDGCVECEENSSSDDNNPCTFNDVFDEDCNCGGTYVYGCIECETNSPCDDNNPCTVNDVFLEDCTCEGTTIDDCDEDECDVGMACDDNDPCTINDVFLENCECQGEESLGAYIIDNQEGVCENIERTLSVSQNFTYYEWTYEGLYFSNNNSINALTSGLYSVEVSNNNCSEILTYRINDYEGHNNDIIKEPNSDICTDEGLQLEIKSGYTNAMWTNSDGEIIDNSSVNEEGIYYVSVQDENNCTLEDGVYVKKVIQGCFIEPVDAFTCINNPISLKVSGIEIIVAEG